MASSSHVAYIVYGEKIIVVNLTRTSCCDVFMFYVEDSDCCHPITFLTQFHIVSVITCHWGTRSASHGYAFPHFLLAFDFYV